MEILQSLTYWHWLVFGLILIVLEVLLPSAIFLWPGVSALLVGIMVFSAPAMASTAFILLWALLSVGFAFGWQVYRKKNPEPSPISSMNKRGQQYIGRHFTLAKDIVNGVGELNVDDTRWKVVSEKDMTAGTKVVVTSLDGTSLRIEKLTSPQNV